MSIDLSKYAEDKLNAETVVAVMPFRWFKFGKVGDVIKGYLVGVTEKANEFKPGEMQKVYEIEAIAGVFHNIVKKVVQNEPTELEQGEFYQVSGKTSIDKKLRHAVPGQLVVLRYTGDFDMGNGNSAKTVDVRIGSVKGDNGSEVEL